ncbi:hypothetical protein [uncultured Methylobacterium sp.]|uniref:hypothetical protein n=1 Tax=uncultured Methylobacterium sp. TaxID=157278 RepID=UPI0035C9E101
MRRLPDALVYVALEVAHGLAHLEGRPLLRQAAFRRAVSGAYYAVFHALCAVCADEMVGWSKTGTHDPIYRTVDHRTARNRLLSPRAAAIKMDLKRVGLLFAHLQDQRHAADYSPPSPLFSQRQVDSLIDQAREAIALIEALSQKDERLRLAILLIAHDRAL